MEGQYMAMGHFVDRRIRFPSPRFRQYSKLQNMGKRESIRNATIGSSFSEGVNVWCGFTAAFIVGPFFFEEIGPSDPVTCRVNRTRYETLLRSQLIPALKERVCVFSTIFIQDGARPRIITSVKKLLYPHFGNNRIISRLFRKAWSPRSSNLNPRDFWLWGYLKDAVYGV
ncbi:hypothetical protein AVEN_164132-1 [Araneus ventricosus]|uniref:PI-PLC Y-box domain-containing protein n=1 Tax=Araneus ventricosus TaxID=182803 RepID=A0A4Y2R5F5_ARAVE|nr:hypothetical protein AVEN_164132-1 [Araneus ventricosus]